MGILKDIVTINPISDGEGYVGMVQEYKAEADTDSSGDGVRPERPFADTVYVSDHDSRLSLANDTWAEILLGSGIVVQGENKETISKINKWFKAINFEEKLEDGVSQFYIKTGNMMFEKAGLMSDISEVDMRTMEKAMVDKKGKVLEYIQRVNSKQVKFKPEELLHFKFSSRTGDVWGKPLANSIVMPRSIGGRTRASPVEEMWEVENAMIKIFQSYASPMMMIHFKDAGEAFIKKIERKMKKSGQGSKILTDKEFEAKVFEVNPASKFDKYIDHLEKNVLEAGSQFATQMLTAGFSARASSESASDVIKLKIRRKQKRLGLQIKRFLVDPYLSVIGKDPVNEDVSVGFQFDSEEGLSLQDVQGLFEKGTITRSEVRRHLDKNTTIEIDTDDMADNPPITSVTPTNKIGQVTGPAAAGLADGTSQRTTSTNVTIPQESLEKLIEIIAEKIPTPRGRPKEGRHEDIETVKMQVLKSLLKESIGEQVI